MACEYKVPDGRDFESVFARGSAGVDTGYKNIVGDDLGSYFAGGGSEVKTGMLTAEGVDLGSIFMPKGDANLQLIYVLMQYAACWVRITIDFQRNSWYMDSPASGVTVNGRPFAEVNNVVTNRLDQDAVLHVYKKMMEGYRVVLDVNWGEDSRSYKNGEGLPAGGGFNVIRTPTLADPRFTFDMDPGKPLRDAINRKHNLTVEVICSVYLH